MATRFFAASFAVLVACGPDPGHDPREQAERYAGSVCDAQASCGCVTEFEDDDACASAFFELFMDAADRPDVDVDGDCVDEVVAYWQAEPCGGGEFPTCVAIQGERQPGESCTPRISMPRLGADDCGAGSSCDRGICRRQGDIPWVLDEGEACSPLALNACGFELFCDNAGVCVPTAGPGESCDPLGCDPRIEPTLFCEGAGPSGTGQCAPAGELGDPCDPTDWLACSADAGLQCDAATRTCAPASQSICVFMNSPLLARALAADD